MGAASAAFFSEARVKAQLGEQFLRFLRESGGPMMLFLAFEVFQDAVDTTSID